MPGPPRHSGVHVHESAGGPAPIAGLPAAIAAFVGRAPRGPVDEPVTVESLADFARTFGEPWTGSTLGHAVRDYFLNGGQSALVVRAHRAASGSSGMARLDAGPLALRAASPGAWGGRLRWRLERSELGAATPVARTLRLNPADLFDLTVHEVRAGTPLEREVVTEEHFRHVTLRDSARRIDRVLAAASQLVQWRGTSPPVPRRVTEAVVDPVTAAQDARGATAPRVQKVIDALGADDGQPLDLDGLLGGGEGSGRGLYALDRAELFTLLCLPPDSGDGDVPPAVVEAAARYCERRRAFLLVDPPAAWTSAARAAAGAPALADLGPNAAVYFPRLRQPDPARADRLGTFAPCGAVAGVIARTDAARGVWKAPAGTDATLAGAPALTLTLTDDDLGALTALGVNGLRTLPDGGPVVWGARTLADAAGSDPDGKYVPVRRLALHLEASIARGLQWVVFEPNGAALWAKVRQRVDAFLQTVFRSGALAGSTAREAFLVRCDATTMTAADLEAGRLVVVVGIAPVRPAEFVMLRIALQTAQPDP
jgi:phage tail sheath protein FI